MILGNQLLPRQDETKQITKLSYAHISPQTAHTTYNCKHVRVCVFFCVCVSGMHPGGKYGPKSPNMWRFLVLIVTHETQL